MASVLTPRQRICLRVLLWLSLFVLANSLFLFAFFPEEAREFTRSYQYMLVAHVVGGVILLVLATVFVFWHLKRVRKLLAPKAVSSGASLTISLYLLFGTGFFLVFYSNSDDNWAFFLAHRVLGHRGAEDPSAQIGENRRHVRGPHLDTEDYAGIVAELEEDGPAAATRRAFAHLADQARRQDLVDDLGDGGARELGLPRDVRARDLALVPDELQHRVGQGPWTLWVRAP